MDLRRNLPALDNASVKQNPDLTNIANRNYTDTILRYGSLATHLPQLDTTAKTVVGAINELNQRTGTTVVPNPPDDAIANLLKIKINADTYDIPIVVANPPIEHGNILTESRDALITEDGDHLIWKAPRPEDVARVKIGDTTYDITDYEVNECLGYDSTVIGLEVDFETGECKRLGDAVGKSGGHDFDVYKMFGGRRRCNVTDQGQIAAYWGDPSYKDDGTNGQVMVYQPAFYYKVVPLKVEKVAEPGDGFNIIQARYYVSETALEGFKLHPAFRDERGLPIDYILIGAYEASVQHLDPYYHYGEYVNDSNDGYTRNIYDVLCSVADVKPFSWKDCWLGEWDFELLASNRGSGWHCESTQVYAMNQLLMLIEMGTLNLKPIIGKGIVDLGVDDIYNHSSQTGSTAFLGNKTGSATSTLNITHYQEVEYTGNGKVAISYRGIENPWGNIRKLLVNTVAVPTSKHSPNNRNYMRVGKTLIDIQGVNGHNNTEIAYNYSTRYDSTQFTLPSESGWISAFGGGNIELDWLFYPSRVQNSVGAIDSYAVNYDSSYSTGGGNPAQLGGGWGDGVRAGAFCSYISMDNGWFGFLSPKTGGRLIYAPKNMPPFLPQEYSADSTDGVLMLMRGESSRRRRALMLTSDQMLFSSDTDIIQHSAGSGLHIYDSSGETDVASFIVTSNQGEIEDSIPLLGLGDLSWVTSSQYPDQYLRHYPMKLTADVLTQTTRQYVTSAYSYFKTRVGSVENNYNASTVGLGIYENSELAVHYAGDKLRALLSVTSYGGQLNLYSVESSSYGRSKNTAQLSSSDRGGKLSIYNSSDWVSIDVGMNSKTNYYPSLVIYRNSSQAIAAQIGLGTDSGGVVYVMNSSSTTTAKMTGQSGNITCVSLTQTSSRKVKENIRPISDSEKILDLDAVSFDYKESAQGVDRRGFIAEEVAEVLPNLVTPESESGIPATLDYIGMIPYLQDVVKKQATAIAILEDRVNKLESGV